MTMDVIMLMAATADGKIARHSDQLVDWTGHGDKAYFVQQTKEAGVMIMGSRTYDTIGRPLPGRKSIVMTRDKSRKSESPDLVFTDKAPGVILAELEEQGFTRVMLIGGAAVNSLFARAHLITHIHLTIVPRLFGTGLSLFDNDMDQALKLIEHREIEPGHILFVYEVIP